MPVTISSSSKSKNSKRIIAGKLLRCLRYRGLHFTRSEAFTTIGTLYRNGRKTREMLPLWKRLRAGYFWRMKMRMGQPVKSKCERSLFSRYLL